MELRHSEFKLLQALFFQHTGITLTECKKQLMISRLAKRVRHHQLDSFYQYYTFIKQDIINQAQSKNSADKGELYFFIDRLTTHETAFFREPKHFTFLADIIRSQFSQSQPLRIWSAACSTGEEPYSIAMTVAEHINHPEWQVVASDISDKVLDQARTRCFNSQEARSIPLNYRLNHCLMGTGSRKHQIKIKKPLAAKISFESINLAQNLPAMASFDFIFLRNVLIYFEDETRHLIIERLASKLKRNGFLLLGHAESLLNHPQFRLVQPTVYQLLANTSENKGEQP